MNAEQLKLLAPPLRELLERRQAKLSHGQALDLIAALVGLRNWPEVLAFPEKAAAREIDLAAIERLIDRAYARFPDRMAVYPHRLKAEDVMGRLAPWRLLTPRDPSLRERLVIASGDSACGCLKWAAIGDAVFGAHYQFTWGPVPLGIDDPSRLFDARLAAWDADPLTSDQPEAWQRERSSGDGIMQADWSEQLAELHAYQRIELWMDPSPNGQLQLLQMLDWFGRQPELLAKLFITHPEKEIGECTPYAVRMMDPHIAAVGAAELQLATAAWRAYREPTPEAWAALLDADLDALPHLRRAARALLEELPAASTGLRASERKMLNLIVPGSLRQIEVMAQFIGKERYRVFGYWELGPLLDGLGRGPEPAVLGLEEGPFDLALHDDQERHKRYRESRLRLTDLGHALLDGKADWATHTQLRYWWGGTRQTPENLWRWDAATERLIPP